MSKMILALSFFALAMISAGAYFVYEPAALIAPGALIWLELMRAGKPDEG